MENANENKLPLHSDEYSYNKNQEQFLVRIWEKELTPIAGWQVT